MPHLFSLAAGVNLALEGDSEFADTVRLVLPRLYLGGSWPAGQVDWALHLERMAASQESKGSASFSGDRVCRIVSRDLRGLGILLQSAIAMILQRARILQIHAAALCPPDCRPAVLFIGPSGSGKSTLTLNLARRGWRFLSDDSVALRESEGNLVALPLRPDFRIVRAGDPRKELFDPERVFPGQRIRSATIGSLIFVEQSGAPSSRLVSLPRDNAFARLPAATPEFGVAEEARWQLGVMARLSTFPSFTLAAGLDVLSEDAALDRLMRSLPVEARAA